MFYWAQGQSGSDTVNSFSKAGGDKLDLRGILTGSGFTPATLNNFLQLTQSGTNAVIKIDVDGGGDFATNAQTITLTSAWSDFSANTLSTLLTQHVILA